MSGTLLGVQQRHTVKNLSFNTVVIFAHVHAHPQNERRVHSDASPVIGSRDLGCYTGSWAAIIWDIDVQK